MDRGAWWATGHGVTESDMTEHDFSWLVYATFSLRPPMIFPPCICPHPFFL